MKEKGQWRMVREGMMENDIQGQGREGREGKNDKAEELRLRER